MMRYGRDKIGFAWVILAPLLPTGGVMTVWSYTMGANNHGVKIQVHPHWLHAAHPVAPHDEQPGSDLSQPVRSPLIFTVTLLVIPTTRQLSTKKNCPVPSRR